jgi:hypothetical protein
MGFCPQDIIMLTGTSPADPQAAVAVLSNTPAPLSASVNDYNPGNGSMQRWAAATYGISVTGMVRGKDTQLIYIWNVGLYSITLTNQDASSQAPNRWQTATGANLTLGPNEIAQAQCDVAGNGVSNCWRVSLLP